jgi:mono/diheme cytochrome c family protein
VNRRHVRSVTVGLAVMLVTVAVLFGWRARSSARDQAAPAAASGSALFQSYCARCHTADELAGRLRAAPDPAVRLREYEALLGSHGEAPAADDRRILEYLASLGR